MAVVADDKRVTVCATCGGSYPACYAGCPRCSEHDDSAWKVSEIVIVVLVVLVALYAFTRLTRISAALSSYLGRGGAS